jgi:hypothetical protein
MSTRAHRQALDGDAEAIGRPCEPSAAAQCSICPSDSMHDRAADALSSAALRNAA